MNASPTRGDEGGQTTQAYGPIDELDLKATVAQVLDRWPCAGLAVAVVDVGGLAWFHGHGFADVAARTPVSQDTVFRIGSIAGAPRKLPARSWVASSERTSRSS